MSQKQELAQQVIKDGKVDADEVTKLREVFLADGEIDREEMDLLFQINTAVSGAQNHSSWKPFFIEAVSSNILADGAIDEDEGTYLAEKLLADGDIDDVEKGLLAELKAKATGTVPEKLEKLFQQHL